MPATHPLWDIPTRLFHWLIVLCVVGSWWSGETENFQRHAWFGYSAIVLVLSRVVWGVIGSQHSRYRDFVRSPPHVWAYLRGRVKTGAGHNPLGGWSVLLLLALLLIQALSGLFNSDDLMFQGPLHYSASVEFRDFMGQVHGVAFNVLVGLIILHIGAVIYHHRRGREPLLRAMIKGRAPGREGQSAPVSSWKALLVAAVIALLLWALISQAPQPQVMW